MTATHTPGPWTLHPTAIHAAVRSVGTPDAGPRRICTVGSMNGNPVDKANARLIAAAPDLLEALIAITTVRCDGMDPTAKVSRRRRRSA